jgi:hypothetical protein
VDGRNTVSIAFALALGAQDRRRLGALGLQHRRLLLALGGEDLRLLDALGVEDRARRSRSARICFSIASWIVPAGRSDFSSTRLTRMPQRPVASSSTLRSSG